jgi:hypothetical protein
MKNVNKKYFECEDGHITVGDVSKSKCGADSYHLNYVKGKRKGSWSLKKEKGEVCKKPIIKEGDIPDEFDFFTEWDSRTMYAFIVGQALDSEFMMDLQKAFCKVKSEIEEIKKHLK